MDLSHLRMSTLVLAIFAGVGFSVLSRLLQLPKIVLLLLGGIIMGPGVLGVIAPGSLGDGLRIIISLCVAVILFEGGMTLHPDGAKKAPQVIWRLLTLGVIITWLGTALGAYLLFDFAVDFSLLTGSLVIVTGPTVIAPLLQKIEVKDKLHHILHWEGVLVDPIGVFIAILCFEWVSLENSSLISHMSTLGFRLLIGMIMGLGGGVAMIFVLGKRIVPEEQINIFVFACALLLFTLSDLFLHEAGILTVVIAGLIIGYLRPPGFKKIHKFKSELTDLCVALVFILLAANLDLSSFTEFGWRMGAMVGLVMFVIRPIGIFICSFNTGISFAEKIFLSWIAPRGVVAGSMASLFAVKLLPLGYENASFLETFTFSIIGCTIILQGLSAGWVARYLKVEEPEKKGWLIVGAHLFARKIAHFIEKNTGGRCVFLDTNSESIAKARKEGFRAVQANALSIDSVPQSELSTLGYLLALTDNQDLNLLISEKWSEKINRRNIFRWSAQSDEMEQLIGGKGSPVWQNLIKPSRIAADLEDKEAIIYSSSVVDYDGTIPQDTSYLLNQNRGKIAFEFGERNKTGHNDILVLKRAKLQLSTFIKQEHLFCLLPASYEDILHNTINHIAKLYSWLPYEDTLEKLLERELELPTVLGNGVVIPHTRCKTITKPLCFIVQVHHGFKINDRHKDPAKLIFILLSPQNNPEKHLILLAEIAKIASQPEKVKSILNAGSSDEVIHLVEQVESSL